MSGTDYVLTPNLGLYKPLPTADIDAWGGHLNSNADMLDTALHSVQTAGPFLPLTGGTVTGATTFNTPTTHGAGSTNYIQISGAASNPTLTVAGAGTNGAMLLQSQGHGSINLRSATGGIITQFVDGSGGTIANFLTVNAKAAGGAVALSTADTAAGLQISGTPLSINRAFTYAGNSSAVGNTILQGLWTINGTSTDTGSTLINYFRTDDNMVTTNNVLVTHFGIWSRANAASAGSRNAFQASMAQTATTASQSHGLSPDWVAQQLNTTAGYNEGGTAGALNSKGAIWGQIIGTTLNPGATYFGGVIGTEYDMIVLAGSSVAKLASISFTGPGTARGTYLTTGIAFSGGFAGVNTGGVSLEHAINFSDQAWGDTCFDNTSTLLYAEFSNSSFSSGTLPIGWFADMLIPTFSGGFLRSKGFSVDGGGTLQIGTGLLKAIAGGVALDAAGSLGTGVPAVAAGGSNYGPGDIIRDGYGGLYKATVSGGAVTAVAVLVQPVVPGSTPANPVTTTAIGLSGGSGCTLNLTWAAGTGLSLNPTGHQILTNLSAAATDAAAATAGVPIGGLYNNAGVVHVRLT